MKADLYRAKFGVQRQYRRIGDALSIVVSKRWAVRVVGNHPAKSALRNAAIKLRNSRIMTGFSEQADSKGYALQKLGAERIRSKQ